MNYILGPKGLIASVAVITVQPHSQDRILEFLQLSNEGLRLQGADILGLVFLSNGHYFIFNLFLIVLRMPPVSPPLSPSAPQNGYDFKVQVSSHVSKAIPSLLHASMKGFTVAQTVGETCVH